MDPALAGLAGAVGAALVEAMTTDFWDTAKARFARIVGRGAHTAEEDISRELEESATRLSRHSPPERAAVAVERERWTSLLAAFLVEHAEATAELQDFAVRLRHSLADAGTGQVVQNISVGGNAYIAGKDLHLSMPLDDDGR